MFMKFLSYVAILTLMSYNIVYSQISGKGLESVSKDKVVYYMVGLSGWAKNWNQLEDSLEIKMAEKIQSSGLIAKYPDNINIASRGCIVLNILFVRNRDFKYLGVVSNLSNSLGNCIVFHSICIDTWDTFS